MKMSIYIARHGEAEVNINPHQKTNEDVFTDLGQKQIALLAERLRDTSIKQIYTSKISRARLTAQKVGEITGIPIAIIESLKERKMIYTGHGDYTPEEQFEDFKKRLIDTKAFLENLSEESVLLVSHALFIKGLLTHILFGEFLTEELLSNINKTLVIDHAAITKLTFTREKHSWKIHYLNDQHHLL